MAHYDIELKNNKLPILFIPATTNKDEDNLEPVIKLSEFNFTNLKFPSNIYICGKRGSGYISLLNFILKNKLNEILENNVQITFLTNNKNSDCVSINSELLKLKNFNILNESDLENYVNIIKSSNHTHVLIINTNVLVKDLDKYLPQLLDEKNNLSIILNQNYYCCDINKIIEKFKYRFSFDDNFSLTKKRKYKAFIDNFSSYNTFESIFSYYTKENYNYIVYDWFSKSTYWGKINLEYNINFDKNINQNNYNLLNMDMDDEILIINHKIQI